MTSDKNNLKFRLKAIRFSMWDLHLYLDTHPCDETAAELLENYRQKYCCIKEEYEKAFGPLTPEDGFGESWLKGPWPWERECDC